MTISWGKFNLEPRQVVIFLGMAIYSMTEGFPITVETPHLPGRDQDLHTMCVTAGVGSVDSARPTLVRDSLCPWRRSQVAVSSFSCPTTESDGQLVELAGSIIQEVFVGPSVVAQYHQSSSGSVSAIRGSGDASVCRHFIRWLGAIHSRGGGMLLLVSLRPTGTHHPT